MNVGSSVVTAPTIPLEHLEFQQIMTIDLERFDGAVVR
jgi:hypothetical protein